MLLYHIGYSTNESIRYHSSSGGIGTAIINYLLERNDYGTSLTFFFDKNACKYVPKLIYSFADYNNLGSIYQDIDLVSFIKENLPHIRNGIVITCMPCQVNAIRSILNRAQVKHFIISLFCSGQTTVEGTWCYYSLLGIKKKDVDLIQYRGNGWPSGIQIHLNNGKIIRRDNYTYPWTLIQKSLLFRPKRCLSCPYLTSPNADVSIGDPWLKRYIDNDTTGHSMILCNSEGERIIQRMLDEQALSIIDVNETVFLSSQNGNIQAKAQAANYKAFNKIVARMGRNYSLYKRVISSSPKLLSLHIRLLDCIRRHFVK